MQQQSTVTHTIRRTEIPASARSSVTNTPSGKLWRAQQISLQTCLSVGLLGIGQNVQLCVGGAQQIAGSWATGKGQGKDKGKGQGKDKGKGQGKDKGKGKGKVRGKSKK